MTSQVLEARATHPSGASFPEASKDLDCDEIFCGDKIRKGSLYISMPQGGNYHLDSSCCPGKSCYDVQVEEF